jgi:hypothetical protein
VPEPKSQRARKTETKIKTNKAAKERKQEPFTQQHSQIKALTFTHIYTASQNRKTSL